MKRRSSPAKSQPKSLQTGQFRIISGKHRGRKINFPATDKLRPTSDRARETIFNWLFDFCQGASCLDLFAGAGSLGLEALSRGACSCTFIEQNPTAAKALNSNLELLGGKGKVITASLPSALESLPKSATPDQNRFDLIFIDPPYALDVIEECIHALEALQLINPDAFVYIESSSKGKLPKLPQSFRLHREKTFGEIHASLFHYQQIS